jgi:hypothetical protein
VKVAVIPSHILRNVEIFGNFLCLLLEPILDSFEEEQSEEVVLVVCRVDAAAEDVGILPEMRFYCSKIERPLLVDPGECLL